MNLSLSIFILLLFFINYSSPIPAENPKFTTCGKTIQCGNIKNITYPFYDGETRPNYCGYPGFMLNCNSSTPQITISNQKYDLLGINRTANTLNISMNNFNFTNACPNSLLNTTIDLNNFNFSPADQNLTFFYDCARALAFPNLFLQTQCDLPGSSSTGYYLTPAMLETNNRLNLLRNCRSVLIPILQSAAELIDVSRSLVALVNAFRAGFELGLITAITGPCSSCVGSGGACGYDSGKFVCYCADGDFDSTCGVDPVNSHGNHNVTALAVGASIGALFLVVAFLVGGRFLVVQQRKKRLLITQQETSDQNPISTSSDNNGLLVSRQLQANYNTSSSSTNYSHSASSYASSRPEDETASSYFGVRVFDYSQLKLATDDFDDSKELGSGGYGRVYYGKLPEGQQVAVKRLYETSFRRMEQFMNEIEILARLRHQNLVTLYGCTSRKSQVLVLVYEYVPNGTVADHLHGKHAELAFLKWPIRLSIAVETAQALAYLHRSDVIHRDVKTTNILLDNEFHVKVADFGLSRLFPNDATHISTLPQGTPGYVDPEYYNCFRLTEKSDVYSFGVILIELISSMQAVDGSRKSNVNLASMALDRIQNQALHELVDPRLGFERDHGVQRMVKMVAELGFRCLQHEKEMRPAMEEVATALRGIQMLEADALRVC